jgi:glucokinase
VKRSVYLGIDIGGTNIKLGIVGAAGGVIARGLIPNMAGNAPRAELRRIHRMLPFLLGTGQELAGVGIGCAGLVDASRGVLISSPNLPKWRNVPLRTAARGIFGVPAIVDNDATAAAYGEFVAGAGVGRRDFICITLGTGVGGGVIADGAVLRGAKNFAGELGHMMISMDGPRCSCGNRGCLEAYIGARGLVRSAREKLKKRNGKILGSKIPALSKALTPRAITKAALAGDRVARDVIEEAAAHLGCGIASLVNLFNPELIAVGGGVSAAFHLMKKRVEKEVSERAYVASASKVVFTRAHLGNDASTVGASMLVKQSLSRLRRPGA